MKTITRTATFAVEDCVTCHMQFAVTTTFQSRRQEDTWWFYCPSGHAMHYTTSAKDAEIERLRAEVADEKSRRDYWQAEERRVSATLAETKRKHAATKGALTKHKRRAAHGVCPCCNRTFANVQRHMAGQHPNYVAEYATAPAPATATSPPTKRG